MAYVHFPVTTWLRTDLSGKSLSLVFDCAEGTQLQLQRSQLKIGQIERIFITHMHADHTLGLIPLLGSLISGISSTPEEREAMAALGTRKRAKINIYGPPGLRLMLRQVLNLTAMTLGDVYAVHELIPASTHSHHTSLQSTSPNGRGNGSSCACEATELQSAEAVGKDIQADEDGCWRDIISQAESPNSSLQESPITSDLSSSNGALSNIWRVDVGPIKHRGKFNDRACGWHISMQ
jgi:ribonuclease Z